MTHIICFIDLCRLYSKTRYFMCTYVHICIHTYIQYKKNCMYVLHTYLIMYLHVCKLPTEVSCNMLSSSYLGLVAMNCVGLYDNRLMHDITLYQNVYIT